MSQLPNTALEPKRIAPLALISLLAATALGTGMAGRILFLILSGESLSALEAVKALAVGLVFDFSVFTYFLIPFVPFLFLPRRLFYRGFFQKTLYILYSFELCLFAFSVIAEAFFIQEFHSRFNFIAVDYLVYTNEVLRNLWESYPLWWILPVLFLFTFFAAKKTFAFFARNIPETKPIPALVRGIASVVAIAAVLALVNERSILKNASAAESDLAKNGIHALFAAYRNNEIDYQRFYSRMKEGESVKLVHEDMEKDWPSLNENQGKEEEGSIARTIKNSGPEKKYNVVLVLMESMSANFMRTYGADKDITPNLDRLTHSSLFFDHVYATGTRTVRGIEAVLLSMPPTPGQSIVRRPGSDGLFSIGSVLKSRGYVNQFIYGGHSYFDNMKEFFSGNHFGILDEANVPVTKDYFSNAWGVADENLFSYVIDKADENWNQGHPFFQFVLTTSNHRPYTYPNGRIDIPSHSGRDGAVKYADYAIGKFLADAEKKPWFKSTIFIFVADHDASVAGGTKILPADYRIPLIFYAPDILKPEIHSIRGSQMDLAPTLFGLMNLSYQSKFFGHDLLRAKNERAFIGTYEEVGYWTGDKLVVLSPNRKVDVSTVKNEIPSFSYSFAGDVNAEAGGHEPAVTTAVAYYETASDWFKENRLKEDARLPADINLRVNP